MNKLLVLSKRLAALAVTAAVATVTYQSYQGNGPGLQVASQVTHAPVQVRRLSDGSLERGLRNETVTSNWSGYAVANFQTNAAYTSALATWTVPTVVHFSRFHNEDSATWVGIGGFCENASCTSVDNTLIQLGTAQNATFRGTSYYAWYEMLPNGPNQIPLAIRPGDSITATLACTAPCPLNSPQTWTLSMRNATTGLSWQGNFTYASSQLSAEWIEEAPSSFAGILPLADYKMVSFLPITANGSMPSLTLDANGIQMKDPWGQTSNPSDPTSYPPATCWGSGSFTPCQ